MKRITVLTMLLACGLLAVSASVLAQSAPATPAQPAAQSVPADKPANWFEGNVNLLLLGRDNVSSSKFEEYRVVPKGVSMPVFGFQGSANGNTYALFGTNISQKNQRYTGRTSTPWLGVAFDYNQIPHNMGNNGRTLFAETAPGVWSMNATARQALGDAVDAVLPATARNYPFYANLLAPTIASAGYVDVSSLRQRGNAEFDLSNKLPFGLTFTYMRELKSGYRGASGGTLYGVVQSIVDVPEPLNEVTQDFGVRWAYNFKSGNVHATFNRNLYNDRQDSLIIDNPFRATDLAYVSASVPGGPAQGRYSTSPDNEATRGAFGVMLKFARQTRIAADMALNTWTQNAPFLPFTINSAVLTPEGASAASLSTLPKQSLDGKINTTTANFSFSSRPIEGLGIRMRYRSYELSNKTTPIVWTGNVGAGDVERRWSASTITADEPSGYATANPYNTTSKRFDGQVSYDIKGLTLEAALRRAKLERTSREATSGDENGYALAAVYHSSDWLGFRTMFDSLKRTAKGWDPATTVGLQADEAEKETTRTGVDVELTPSDKVGLTFTYARRNDDYPNRPDRHATAAGSPSIPGTPSGLLKASYDTYTVEAEFTPSQRAELSAYYTYEKTANVNQTVTLTGTALNNLIRFDVSDKGNTFGANALIHFVPEKVTFSLMLRHQKMDGLFGVTANPTGTFSIGRSTLNPPGPQDITDYDDTTVTSAVADLGYAFAKDWTFSLGYAYDKYTAADAFSDGTTIFPQSVLFYLKANDGNYTANVAYTRLSYRW